MYSIRYPHICCYCYNASAVVLSRLLQVNFVFGNLEVFNRFRPRWETALILSSKGHNPVYIIKPRVPYLLNSAYGHIPLKHRFSLQWKTYTISVNARLTQIRASNIATTSGLAW